MHSKYTELNWSNTDLMLSNFRLISLNNAGTDELNIGYEALADRLNKLASMKWSIITSTDKVKFYVSLFEFKRNFSKLSLTNIQPSIRHLSIVLNVIAESLDENEMATARDKINELAIEEYSHASKSELDHIRSILDSSNIIEPSASNKMKIKLDQICKNPLANEQLKMLAVEIRKTLTNFPVSQVESSSLSIKPRSPAKLSHRSLVRLTVPERNHFDSSNGFGISYEKCLENSQVAFTRNVNLKAALPLLRRSSLRTCESEQLIKHHCSLGSIHQYPNRFNFAEINEMKAAKIAIKLIMQLGWTTVIAWGSDMYLNELNRLCTKKSISFASYSGAELLAFKSQFETNVKPAVVMDKIPSRISSRSNTQGSLSAFISSNLSPAKCKSLDRTLLLN